MRPTRGRRERLTLFLCERDTYKHHSLAGEVVQRAKDAGMAGATMFRWIEGYGRSGRIHTARLLTMSEDLPLTVVIIDSGGAIDWFVEQLDELIWAALATVENVQVVRRARDVTI